MTRRDRVIQWTAYTAALLLTAAVNYYVLAQLPISLPLLLPAAAVVGGVLEGPAFGAAYGGLAGLVMAGFGHTGIGGCAAGLAAAGWLSGLAARYVLRRDLWGHLLCTAVTLLCWELWQVGSRYFAGTAELEPLLRVALPELGWSLPFALPVYWAGRFCCVHYGRIYYE